MNLQPCSVDRALTIIGGVLGLSPEHDREELLDYLNRIRSLWYHTFHRRRLFDDWLECVPTRQLHVDCISCGSDCYVGFSLPLNMAGPVSAWSEKSPVNLRSRWREKFTGRWAGSASLDMVEQPGEYPVSTEPTGQFKIRILAGSEDDGKTVTIKALTCDDCEKTICFELKGDSWVESSVWVKRIISIVLPPRISPVTIAAENENGGFTDIDTHCPSDPNVPSFRRFKIKSPCHNVCSVYVQASRRFREIYNDSDVVEIGDRLVLEHGASYFKNAENTIDTKELNRGDRDLAIMNELIGGMIAREQGDSNRDGPVPLRGRRTRKARLPGYTGRR